MSRNMVKIVGCIILCMLFVISTLSSAANLRTNDPPDKPDKPSGPIEGKVGKEYTYYTTNPVNPSGDITYYKWDWDDGTLTDWLSYDSGQIVISYHIWSEEGKYNVKIKAKNDYGESPWSDPLTVTIVNNDDYDVELSCDDPYQDVKLGETALYIVEITNTGVLDDTYDVTAGSIEDIVCKVNGVNADQFDPYPISLQAGGSTTFEVTAEVGESVPEGEWYYVRVKACSQNDTEVCDELILTVGTGPPKPPRPSGPQNGKVGEQYEYYIDAPVVPDGEEFSYLFNWGDGTDSGWLGPIPGGERVFASHTWTEKGFYEVRVKAKDDFDVESEWSDPLSVSMPKNKDIENNDGSTRQSLFSRLVDGFRGSTDESDSSDGQQSSLFTRMLQNIFGRSPSNTQTPASTPVPVFPIIKELLSRLR